MTPKNIGILEIGVSIAPSIQIALNIKFKSLIPVSRISVFPNYLSSSEIGQIILETENSKESSISSTQFSRKAILTSSISLDKKNDIDLDNTYMVKSISIILVQKNYTRTKINAVQSEINSKMILQIFNEIKNSRKENHDTLQDFVIRFFLRDTEKTFLLRNNKIYSYNYTSYYPTNLSKTNFGVIEKLDRNTYFSDMEAFNKFKNTSLLSNIVFSIVSYALGARLRNQISSTYLESNTKDTQKSLSSFKSTGLIPVGDSNIVDKNIHFFEQNFISVDKSEATQLLNSIEDNLSYEYTLSINHISFFTKKINTSQFNEKSFFVSKKIPTKGKPLRVKLLADYFDELISYTDDVSKDKTSIEFSVTTKDYPTAESDWQPIVPYSENSIRSEILYLNSNGEARLRFEPLIESVVLYENSIKKLAGSYFVNGKNIKINGFNKSNKYFVSYSLKYPNTDKEVSFATLGSMSDSLASSGSNGANGEYFEVSNQGNRIRLSYNPYIDFSKLHNASYSSYTGTITSSKTDYGNFDHSSYSPVKIIFEDGSTAINLTNYIIDNNEIESFYDTDNVLFIHHGDSILFNKSIEKPFRVIYQYVPDCFRYRVVMRSLTADSQNYTVDRLIFKFLTEKRDDLLINLIKYDNLFKNKVN